MNEIRRPPGVAHPLPPDDPAGHAVQLPVDVFHQRIPRPSPYPREPVASGDCASGHAKGRAGLLASPALSERRHRCVARQKFAP